MRGYFIFCHFYNDDREHSVIWYSDGSWFWNAKPDDSHMFYATELQLDALLRKVAVWAEELHLTITVVEI